VIDGRVNGELGVARSFGDVRLKKYGVTAMPELKVKFQLTTQEEFLLLACDGLWSRLNENMALSYIRPRIWAASSWCRGEQYKWKLSSICRGLVDDAIHEKGCQDNCSAMIIQLQHKDQDPKPLVLG